MLLEVWFLLSYVQTYFFSLLVKFYLRFLVNQHTFKIIYKIKPVFLEINTPKQRNSSVFYSYYKFRSKINVYSAIARNKCLCLVSFTFLFSSFGQDTNREKNKIDTCSFCISKIVKISSMFRILSVIFLLLCIYVYTNFGYHFNTQERPMI